MASLPVLKLVLVCRGGDGYETNCYIHIELLFEGHSNSGQCTWAKTRQSKIMNSIHGYSLPLLSPLFALRAFMLLAAASVSVATDGADETDAMFDLGIAISDSKHPLLSWEAESDRTYSILHSSDLSEFTTLESGFPDGGAGQATLEFEDTNVDTDSQNTAFYKVVLDALDNEDPVVSSGETGTDLTENSGAGQVVYTTVASDNVGVHSYSLGGTDASLLAISTLGEVTLTADPDYENKSSYSFDVIVADAEGNTATQAVTFSITDVVNYTIMVRAYSYDPETGRYSHNTTADDLEFQTDVQGCTVWTRTAQGHDDFQGSHDHYNAYVDPIYDESQGTFKWTEYGSEESQEAIEETCVAEDGGETKTVSKDGYYKDKNNHSVYLQILSIEAN